MFLIRIIGLNANILMIIYHYKRKGIAPGDHKLCINYLVHTEHRNLKYQWFYLLLNKVVEKIGNIPSNKTLGSVIPPPIYNRFLMVAGSDLLMYTAFAPLSIVSVFKK